MLVRKTPLDMIHALVAEQNRRQLDAVASFFHVCQSETVTGGAGGVTITRTTITTANGSDLATNITLVNAIKVVYNKHAVDSAAHNTAVSAVVSTADATDLATAITLANALKAAHEAHRVAAGVHYTNDTTNAIAALNATDLASLQTLNNEMKGDINAHIISAPTGSFIELVSA